MRSCCRGDGLSFEGISPFHRPMGQLNQFAGAGKLATAVPLRSRALRITVRGPDVSGTRAVSGKQRNFRGFQRQLQKQNPALGRAGQSRIVCFGAGVAYGRAILLNSRISASAWRSSMFRARSCWRTLPLSALRATLALPAALVGPVDRSHGLQRLMASACRCLRSGVQGVAMLRLQ